MVDWGSEAAGTSWVAPAFFFFDGDDLEEDVSNLCLFTPFSNKFTDNDNIFIFYDKKICCLCISIVLIFILIKQPPLKGKCTYPVVGIALRINLKGWYEMSKKTFLILTIIGFVWGVWGGFLLGPNPPLVFGWLPLSVISISLTGFYAAIINYLYFKNYGEAN